GRRAFAIEIACERDTPLHQREDEPAGESPHHSGEHSPPGNAAPVAVGNGAPGGAYRPRRIVPNASANKGIENLSGLRGHTLDSRGGQRDVRGSPLPDRGPASAVSIE